MPIREVGQIGERKNPRGRRKKRKKPREGRVGAELKHHHDAINLNAKLEANDPGAMLGAKVISVMVAATSPLHLRRRVRHATTLASKIMVLRRVISAPITTAPS
jgi:hypothetical protein